MAKRKGIGQQVEEAVRKQLPAVPTPGSPITAAQIGQMEQYVAERVALISDIETLRDWHDKARALEAYLRSRELQRPMLGAQRRVEARIGQLLGEPEKGGRGKTRPYADKFKRNEDRHDFRILAAALNGDAQLAEDEWRKSRRALVALLRQRLGMVPQVPEIPAGAFRCIVADPPWQQDTGPDVFGGTGERGHDALEYRQMSVEAIQALPVEQRAAEDSHLYLWTINRYIEQAYSVARAWGFKPSVLLVWAKKPHGVGLGDAYRLTTEFVLYARRGSLKEMQIVKRSWFDWPRGRHSEKPAAFYEMVEKMTPAPGGAAERLELFARSQRPGWTVWGDESG